MRKCINFCLCIILSTLSIFLLTSFTSNDLVAESVDLKINDSEYGKLLNIEKVYDCKNNVRYEHYTYDKGGYEIFDTVNQICLEKSSQKNSSPFYCKNGKFYYLGLNEYAYFDGKNYKDVYDCLWSFIC